MTDTILTGQTPNQPADHGGVTNRSVGNRFQVSTAGKRISSGRYWVPAEGIGTGTLFQLWNGSTSEVSFDLNTALPSPTLNAINDVPFPAAFFPPEDIDLVVCVALDGASYYRFSTGITFPLGSGSVSADTAIYAENLASIGSGPPTNTGFSGGLYFVDVNVEDAAVAATGLSTVILLGSSVVEKIAKLTGAASAVSLGTTAARKASSVTAISTTVAAGQSAATKIAMGGGASSGLILGSATAKRVIAVSGFCSAVALGFRPPASANPGVLTASGAPLSTLTTAGAAPVLTATGTP